MDYQIQPIGLKYSLDYFRFMCISKNLYHRYQHIDILDEYQDTYLLNAKISIIAHEKLLLDTWYGPSNKSSSSTPKLYDFKYSIVKFISPELLIATITNINDESSKRSLSWCKNTQTYIIHDNFTLHEVNYPPEFIYKYNNNIDTNLSLLAEYVTNNTINKYIPNDIVIFNQHTTTHPFLLTLEDFNKKISNELSLKYHPQQGLGYIQYISQTNPYDVGFHIPIICALFSTYKNLNELQTNIQFIQILAEHQLTSKLFKFILQKLFEHPNEFIEIIDIYKKYYDPYFIIQYVTIHRRHNISADDNITQILKKLALPNNTLNNQTILFPYFFTCHTTISDDHVIYIQNTGSYKYITNQKLKDTFLEIELIHQKYDFLSDYQKYLTSINNTSRHFEPGKYKYFINTQIGIFCTITGTYMRKTPFLQFLEQTQQKKFCLTDPHNLLPPNLYAINNNDHHLLLKQYIHDTDTIWLQNIFLKNAQNIHLNENEANKLFIILNKRIKIHHKHLFEKYRKYISSSLINDIANKLTTIRWNSKPLQQLLSTNSNSTSTNSTTSNTKYELLAIAILLIENQTFVTTHDEYHIIDELQTFNYIAHMCDWDQTIIYDFFLAFSQLYKPDNNNKNFFLLHGISNAGKSTFVNYLLNWHGRSQFVVNESIKMPSNPENPASVLIKTATSYFSVVNEAKYLSTSIIKILTGNDVFEARSLYESNTKLITPICFILCVSNNFPEISTEQAILNRIVLFNLTRVFVNHNHNVLKSFINNEIQSNSVICNSQLIANIFYYAHKLMRNEHNTYKNQKSANAINKFKENNMIKRRRRH